MNFTSHTMTDQDVLDWLKSGFLYNFSEFAMPNSDSYLVGWGQFITSRQPVGDGPWLYAPDFYLEVEEPWFRYENLSLKTGEELTNLLKRAQGTEELQLERIQFQLQNFDWEMPDSDHFKKVLKTIQGEIKKGRLEKAVPVVFEKANFEFDIAKRLTMLTQVINKSGLRRAYGQWSLETGMIGATPEVLFSYHGDKNILQTMSLAGTRRSDLEKKNPLLEDKKEVHEQSLVTKMISERLSPLGDLSMNGPYPWDVGLITHLRTDLNLKLSAQTDESFVEALIQKLHPTPALGLSSKTLDFHWLKKIEGRVHRHRYGAPFGIYNFNQLSEFAVAIRNIQWDQEDVLIGSGCGIVAQSTFEKEWEELKLKRRTVKDFLSLPN
ncbi:MAG: chorismate-binding protein [Bdellovibrionota bacterium]